MSEKENSSKKKLTPNRRTVLKGAAAGSMSLFGIATSVGASPEEASVDIDSVLVSDKVATLKEEIPGLELNPDSARVLGGDEGVVGIPANHGILVTHPPEGSISERAQSLLKADKSNREIERPEVDAASFYFSEWIPSVDNDWPKGTQARLRVSDDGAVLLREPTDEEAEQFLSSVGPTEFDRENMAIGVEPETGRVTITHIDTENRQFNRIEAEPSKAQTATADAELAAAKAGLEVTERKTEEFLGGSQDIGTHASCDADDVIVCVIEAQSCWPCLIAGVSGPVALACWFFVCLGFPGEPIATILADVGCLNLAGCAVDEVTDIVDYILDEFGDQIPV